MKKVRSSDIVKMKIPPGFKIANFLLELQASKYFVIIDITIRVCSSVLEYVTLPANGL